MNQKGFAHFQVVVMAVVVIGVMVFTGIKVLRKNTTKGQGVSVTAHNITKNPSNTSQKPSNNSGLNQTTPAPTAAQQTTTSNNKTTTPAQTSTTNNPTQQPPSPTSNPSLSAVGNPTVSITSPSEGAVITGDHFDVTCSSSAPAGVNSITEDLVDSNGQSVGSVTSYGSNCEATFYTYMPNGTYTLTLTLHDNAGHTATDSHHITIQV